MSRSRHQRHKLFRRRKFPWPISPYWKDGHGWYVYKKRKMQPFGNVVGIGYGDEPYIRHLNGELYIPIINKKRERRRTVQNIKEQIDALPNEQKERLLDIFMSELDWMMKGIRRVYG